MSTIKAGYRLSITSWENDADNYNTEILDGLTKEQAELTIDLCRLCEKSSWEGGHGNMYEPSDDEIQAFHDAIKEVLLKHGQDIGDDEYLDDRLSETGLIYSGDFYTRHLDKLIVEYVPVDIVLEDVTAQFVK